MPVLDSMPSPTATDMAPRTRSWRPLWLAVGALALAGGFWAWTMWHVEDIPEQLEAMNETPDSITLESLSEVPKLVLGEQRGFKSFYVVIGMRTPEKEGVSLNRALNRWHYPGDVQGYIVGDAEGAGLFRSIAAQYLDFFRKEARFPIFVDFHGAMNRVFKLAKGHHGFVVLDADGSVLVRKSGGMTEPELDTLRVLLGATEPPAPAPAPEFSIAGLDKASCADRPCVVIFLGSPVRRTEIPRIEGGFEGDTEAGMQQMNRPAIRLVSSALKMDLRGAHGVLVGDVDLPIEGFSIVPEDAPARATFGLAPTETAMVIIDEQGRLALREVGLVPMYKWGAAADLLGAEIMSGDTH